MSYQIKYSVEENYRYPIGTRHTHKRKLVGSAVVVLILIVLLCLPQIRSWLIPGDQEVTRAAFSKLVENIQNGESFAQAIDAFGREIIQHGY